MNLENRVKELESKVSKYEDVIFQIANIDTIFYDPSEEGAEEWNDKIALEEIQKLVIPIWEEHCIEVRKLLEDK